MLTATVGFRHDSIATARQVMSDLAASSGAFTVSATEDLNTISDAGLSNFDVVFFALTSGDLPISAAQKTAFLSFVTRGGGFLGAHSASDTFYSWPDYGMLLGAYFKEHPWTQQGTVLMEDASHPAAGNVGASYSLVEEFYTFQENPRPRVHVLARLDPASVGSGGGDFPLTWVQSYGNGRAYYNALGHFPDTWRDSRFQAQLVAAIRWVAKRS
jgi:type 1 glutamine amidotransferase